MTELPVNIIVPTIVSLAVVLLGYFANRKLGITPGQLVLVQTLKDTVDVMGIRVGQLQAEFESCKSRLVSVERMKKDLEQTVDDLRAELRDSRRVHRKITR